MYPVNFENYPDWLKLIHAKYIETALWRNINWYDYLEQHIIPIIKEVQKERSSLQEIKSIQI